MTHEADLTTAEIVEKHKTDLEVELEVYPLRDPSEDPGWALWVMWIWIGIAVFLLLFFVVLTILGIFYD